MDIPTNVFHHEFTTFILAKRSLKNKQYDSIISIYYYVLYLIKYKVKLLV